MQMLTPSNGKRLLKSTNKNKQTLFSFSFIFLQSLGLKLRKADTSSDKMMCLPAGIHHKDASWHPCGFYHKDVSWIKMKIKTSLYRTMSKQL